MEDPKSALVDSLAVRNNQVQLSDIFVFRVREILGEILIEETSGSPFSSVIILARRQA